MGYYLLTGRPVFESDSDLDMATQVLNTPPQRPSQVALQPIPAELDLALYRCLAKSRADRPQTIDELIRVFDGCLGDQPWRGIAAQGWWARHGAVVLRADAPVTDAQVVAVIETDLGSEHQVP